MGTRLVHSRYTFRIRYTQRAIQPRVALDSPCVMLEVRVRYTVGIHWEHIAYTLGTREEHLEIGVSV